MRITLASTLMPASGTDGDCQNGMFGALVTLWLAAWGDLMRGALQNGTAGVIQALSDAAGWQNMTNTYGALA